MQNMLVVNAEGPEIRVAVVEDGALAEFFVERKRDRGIVGNIYRGKVTRVLPGMQAAFVDLGPKVERAAFLYVADVLGSGEEKKLFDDADTDDVGDDSPEGRAAPATARCPGGAGCSCQTARRSACRVGSGPTRGGAACATCGMNTE